MTEAKQQNAGNSMQWLEDLFELHPDALLLLGADQIIKRANDSAVRLFGGKSNRLIGSKARSLVPHNMAAKWDRDMARLLANEWNFLETCAAVPHGRPVPIAVHGIHTKTDDQPAIILHVHDLSIYRNIERALMASSNQWDQCFDAITDYLCVLDRNGIILRANQTMNERLAPSAGNLVGVDYRAVLGLSEPTNPAYSIPDAVQQAPLAIESTRLPNLPGVFSIMAYPLQRNSEASAGAVLVIRDITDMHETREALTRTEISLLRAAKMEAIGRLAGGIAHDFNNILTTILGYSSIALRNLKSDDPVRDDIKEITAAGERASALIRQLLDFSHDRATETQSVNINEMLRNMERFLCRTIGDNVRLVVRLDPALWPVQADVSRLEQIIMNLVVNARDALEAPGIITIQTGNTTLDQVFCETRPDIAPGEYVKIEVSDTGHGMSPEVLSHIFEPFFTTKPQGRGSGIGLSSVYGIVRQFRGCISCYSEPQKGATFKIYLPRACCDALEKQTDNPLLKETPAAPRGTERILVVDDEPNIAQIIAQILGDIGYRVLMASTCDEAIARFDQVNGNIDVFLSDISMPCMTGPDLYKKFKKQHPTLKALFMSGYADPSDLAGTQENETDFIQKPFSFDTLACRIREILDRDAETPPQNNKQRNKP